MSALLATPLTGGRGALRLARQALLVLVALAVPTLLAAGALRGRPGVTGAAAGLALVGVLFGVAGLAQALAARRSPSALIAVVLTGLAFRLVIYLAALQALGSLPALHRPSLALATAFGLVVTLTYEMRLVSRTPELFWVDAGGDRSGERASA
jgi:hypothetical protein